MLSQLSGLLGCHAQRGGGGDGTASTADWLPSGTQSLSKTASSQVWGRCKTGLSNPNAIRWIMMLYTVYTHIQWGWGILDGDRSSLSDGIMFNVQNLVHNSSNKKSLQYPVTWLSWFCTDGNVTATLQFISTLTDEVIVGLQYILCCIHKRFSVLHFKWHHNSVLHSNTELLRMSLPALTYNMSFSNRTTVQGQSRRSRILFWSKHLGSLSEGGFQSNHLSQQGLGHQDFWVSWPVDPYGAASVSRSIHSVH